MNENEGREPKGTEEVVETTETVEVTTDTAINGDLNGLSPEQLSKVIQKLRKENANARVKNNELKPLADKYRELEESQKSDLQKAQERVAALEAEKASLEKASLRDKVAREYGVAEDLLEFIDGADEEEMRSRAQKLGTRTQQVPVADTDAMLAGPRGGNVGERKEESATAWFDSFLKGN